MCGDNVTKNKTLFVLAFSGYDLEPWGKDRGRICLSTKKP